MAGPCNFEYVAQRGAQDPRANVGERAIRANFICVTNEIPRCWLQQHYSGPVAGPINLVSWRDQVLLDISGDICLSFSSYYLLLIFYLQIINKYNKRAQGAGNLR